MDYAAQLLSSYEKTLLKKAKHFIATHPKTVKGAFITLQALTIASAFFDDGASLGALPEEEWLEAAAEAVAAEAAETAAETAESTEAAEGAGSKASDALKSIEKAQQRIRSGSDKSRIIDSIRKSEQRLKNMLRKAHDPTDWE